MSRFRLGRTPELAEAARKAARWVADNIESIRESGPDIPGAIYNRAADNWEPLLAIADVAGGEWPERARQAALVACGVEDEPSYGAKLLTDIREAFEESGGHRMSSAHLTAALVGMPDRPWCECNHGKALTQNGLANRLRKFGIRTKTLRAKGEQSKCYEADVFADAFARYCPIPAFKPYPVPS